MMAAVCLMAAMTFAAQCAATTKKGTQCKRQASPDSEFCWQHGGTTKAEREANGEGEAPRRTSRRVEREESVDEAPAKRARPARSEGSAANDAPASVEGQCQATTKHGTQCRRKAVEGGRFCAQHAAKNGEPADDTPAARPPRRKSQKAGGEDAPAPVAETGMCAATTKAGTPCRRKAVAGGKYCAQHAARMGEGGGEAAARPRRTRKPAETADEPSATPAPKRTRRAKKDAEPSASPSVKTHEAASGGGMCQGRTKAGDPCKRKARPGSNFCRQHEK